MIGSTTAAKTHVLGLLHHPLAGLRMPIVPAEQSRVTVSDMVSVTVRIRANLLKTLRFLPGLAFADVMSDLVPCNLTAEEI